MKFAVYCSDGKGRHAEGKSPEEARQACQRMLDNDPELTVPVEVIDVEPLAQAQRRFERTRILIDRRH